MKILNTFRIFLVLCIGLVISLCLANGETPQVKPNQEHMAWVEKCLTDFESIKPGMTRGEIEKKFPMDGGAQGVSPVRFTHPECGYFKVAVEFDFKRNEKDQGRAIISPDDKATKVSTPYIERPFTD
ncbi:MAG: hypothetical protein ABSA64_02205 [Sedimentisphaerales bacterium]